MNRFGKLACKFVAAMAVTGTAIAADPAPQAEIPFANLGGIESWRADGDSAMLIEGRNRQWYRAEFMSPCIGLRTSEHVGFVSEPMGTFDKFSSIIVQHQECYVKSLVKTDPPSKNKDKM